MYVMEVPVEANLLYEQKFMNIKIIINRVPLWHEL
jgi:hypothetical protein